jgi:membrane-bound serine protease (ClpP class)
MTGLPTWVAALGFAVFVVKDFMLWPLVRGGYESNVATGAERLVGAQGVTRGRVEPRGYVHVRGELWQAEILPGAAPLPAGTEVRIERAEGMTLFVAKV